MGMSFGRSLGNKVLNGPGRGSTERFAERPIAFCRRGCYAVANAPAVAEVRGRGGIMPTEERQNNKFCGGSMMKRRAKILAVIVLFSSSIGCGGKPDEPKKEATVNALPTRKVEGRDNVTRPEITIQIRDPWNRGNAVQVRLDIDRLHAYGLSEADVMSALTTSGTVDPKEPLPPPGVVFNRHLSRPDQYENVILKANPEGDIVRLKDVAKVELLNGREAQEAKSNATAGKEKGVRFNSAEQYRHPE